MKEDEGINEFQRLFDQQLGSSLTERDYSDAWGRFLDHSLMIVEELKRHKNPQPKAVVQKQLSTLQRALNGLSPQARNHLERILNFPKNWIGEPNPIDEMRKATAAKYRQDDTTRSYQKRLLINLAKTAWIGDASKYDGTRFVRYVGLLADLAGMSFNAETLKRGLKDDPELPVRLDPGQL
jgi:hypothetical protein